MRLKIRLKIPVFSLTRWLNKTDVLLVMGSNVFLKGLAADLTLTLLAIQKHAYL